ncbi:hypothetical protein E2C01_010867 [Portunus trituberculatus]|uniref:Uncharacterized protein n=1 Tax=Portunus trituberculatus TaxID=210409 RepID=A0A5B7DA15_PORTR|nr:hypothetical protein [Portunus trituberculatus]
MWRSPSASQPASPSVAVFTSQGSDCASSPSIHHRLLTAVLSYPVMSEKLQDNPFAALFSSVKDAEQFSQQHMPTKTQPPTNNEQVHKYALCTVATAN